MIVMTIVSRVSPLIIIILCLGLLGEISVLLFISLFFGGGFESIAPLFG